MHPKEGSMNPSRPLPQANSQKHRHDLEQIEQSTRETAWENEGGRALMDEKRAAAAMNFGDPANDNGAEAS
jgi:hypothetical protein